MKWKKLAKNILWKKLSGSFILFIPTPIPFKSLIRSAKTFLPAAATGRAKPLRLIACVASARLLYLSRTSGITNMKEDKRRLCKCFSEKMTWVLENRKKEHGNLFIHLEVSGGKVPLEGCAVGR